MSRIFKETKDETKGRAGPFVYLVLGSGRGSNVGGVYNRERSAHAMADVLQQRSEDNWDPFHFWVEKHARRND